MRETSQRPAMSSRHLGPGPIVRYWGQHYLHRHEQCGGKNVCLDFLRARLGVAHVLGGAKEDLGPACMQFPASNLVADAETLTATFSYSLADRNATLVSDTDQMGVGSSERAVDALARRRPDRDIAPGLLSSPMARTTFVSRMAATTYLSANDGGYVTNAISFNWLLTSIGAWFRKHSVR